MVLIQSLFTTEQLSSYGVGDKILRKVSVWQRILRESWSICTVIIFLCPYPVCIKAGSRFILHSALQKQWALWGAAGRHFCSDFFWSHVWTGEKCMNSKTTLHVFTFPYLQNGPHTDVQATAIRSSRQIFHLPQSILRIELERGLSSSKSLILKIKNERGKETEVGQKEKHNKHIQSHAEALIELCR